MSETLFSCLTLVLTLAKLLHVPGSTNTNSFSLIEADLFATIFMLSQIFSQTCSLLMKLFKNGRVLDLRCLILPTNRKSYDMRHRKIVFESDLKNERCFLQA